MELDANSLCVALHVAWPSVPAILALLPDASTRSLASLGKSGAVPEFCRSACSLHAGVAACCLGSPWTASLEWYQPPATNTNYSLLPSPSPGASTFTRVSGVLPGCCLLTFFSLADHKGCLYIWFYLNHSEAIQFFSIISTDPSFLPFLCSFSHFDGVRWGEKRKVEPGFSQYLLSPSLLFHPHCYCLILYPIVSHSLLQESPPESFCPFFLALLFWCWHSVE